MSGASEARAISDLATQAALGALGLLTLAAGHWRNLLLLVASAPLAWDRRGALGGHEASLTLGSLVGFATLFGITPPRTLATRAGTLRACEPSA